MVPAAGAQSERGSTPTGEDTPLQLPDTDTAQNVGGGGGLVRTIVGLLIVIAVIYGVTWVLRQIKASQEETGSGSGLDSHGSLPLGAGRSLHLVRAGDEYMLLGVSDGGVTRLRTYTEQEAEAAGLLEQTDGDAFREVGVRRGQTTGPLTIGEAGARLMERLRSLTVRR